MSTGSVMFSAAVSVGTRLNAWKMNPTLSRRARVLPFSSSAESSRSPSHTCPEVSESSPARQCMRVDLPEPEGPMMAVKTPAANSASMPSSARTSASPTP